MFPSSVTVTLTVQQLAYIKRAVTEDLRELESFVTPDAEIIRGDMRLANSVLLLIDKTEQTQVYVH